MSVLTRNSFDERHAELHQIPDAAQILGCHI
jgi:hypothetical protein